GRVPKGHVRCQAPDVSRSDRSLTGAAHTSADERAKSAPRRGLIATESSQDGRCIDEGKRSADPKRCREAAPGPVFGSVDDAGSNGIVDDIPVRGQERRVVLLPARPEAIPDEIANPSVPSVERLRILGVQPMHARGQGTVGNLYERMPVGRHLAEPDAPPAIPLEQMHKTPRPIHVVYVVAEVRCRP